MSVNKESYAGFGNELSRLREAQGMAHQADLATALGVAQQTVSRWEKGISRPRQEQIQRIGSLLQIKDTSYLFALAGYGIRQGNEVAAVFDKPFPLMALSPESFERFCMYFLSHYYKTGAAHLSGKQGHKQNGIDIEVTTNDGKYLTFQCKRHKSFGPEKVRQAIQDNNVEAHQNFLLLAGTASPKARKVVLALDNWDIWDVDDISRMIRQCLNENERISLVDTFFRGRRYELLGINDAGPWQTPDEYYSVFSQGLKSFNHNWELVGRNNEVDKINTAILNQDTVLINVIGPGGTGKTKIIKQVVECNRKMDFVFVSQNVEIKQEHIEKISTKNHKIIIVDDAHERSDLNLLFSFCAIKSNNTKLIMAFRPYGKELIEAQAHSLTITPKNIEEVRLLPLKKEDVVKLSEQVIESYGGDKAYAEEIAALTSDCTLATVVGSQIVATNEVRPILLSNEHEFRSMLMARFRDLVTGDLGRPRDIEQINKILRIISVMQPVSLDDKQLCNVTKAIENISESDTTRLFKFLVNSGLLIKRAGAYRIAPDLLADYLIEESCIGLAETSTGYAESIFKSVNGQYIENILVNMGRLDWKKANGEPSNSKLLVDIWKEIKPNSKYGDEYTRAVEKVAFYQPEQALEFVNRAIKAGFRSGYITNIIKNAAYNYSYISLACEYLWEIGKTDDRELHPNPSHGIRTLRELAEFAPNKPISYNERVIEYALSLIPNEENWMYTHTPLTILEGALVTEGHTTMSNGFELSMSPFFISPDAVRELRDKTINHVLDLLAHDNTAIAVKAAVFLQNALRGPIGILGASINNNTRNQWDKEFHKTLKAISRYISEKEIKPPTYIEIARSVNWHAQHGTKSNSIEAANIIANLPSDLEFRTYQVMMGGWSYLVETGDFRESEKIITSFRNDLIRDLFIQYKNEDELIDYLESILSQLDQANVEYFIGSNQIIEQIINENSSIYKNIIKRTLDKNKLCKKYLSIALRKNLYTDHSEAMLNIRKLQNMFDDQILCGIGSAYSWYTPDKSFTKDDIDTIKELLQSTNHHITRSAINAIRKVRDHDDHMAIDLVLSANFNHEGPVLNDIFMCLEYEKLLNKEYISSSILNKIFDKLLPVKNINDYWVEDFLSKISSMYPEECLLFFKKRIEYSCKNEDWEYKACIHGPYRHIGFNFTKNSNIENYLADIVNWAKSSKYSTSHMFQYRISEFWESITYPFNDDIVDFLTKWLNSSSDDDFILLSHLIRGFPNSFVFDYQDYIFKLLDTASRRNKDIYDSITSALYGLAVTGSRSGAAGEPFPRDLQMKEDATNIIFSLPIFHPARPLYEDILKTTQSNIDRQLKEREIMSEL